MGDIIHTLPAVTDAMNAIAGIRFDWVVEEGFKEIPHWHSAVDKVIPVAIRRWRKAPIKTWRSGEWKAFKDDLQQREYDAVIDAQGLLKSAALVVRCAHGPSYGYDKDSIKEPLASRFYQHVFQVDKDQHAIERIRQLFANALNYPCPQSQGEFGVSEHFERTIEDAYLVFNHGTTRVDKHYPEVYWQDLIKKATDQGWSIKLPWGNDKERSRAQLFAQDNDKVQVLSKMSLCEVSQIIANAAGCISVDTGLSHLSAALNKPNLTLFGPTDPGLVGGYGNNQKVLLASDYQAGMKDCANASGVEPAVFEPLSPGIVWEEFSTIIAK
jgi:heptosyltransferase-1